MPSPNNRRSIPHVPLPQVEARGRPAFQQPLPPGQRSQVVFRLQRSGGGECGSVGDLGVSQGCLGTQKRRKEVIQRTEKANCSDWTERR